MADGFQILVDREASLEAAAGRGEVPTLLAPVRVEPVGDKGTLVTRTPERLPQAVPSTWRSLDGPRER